MNPILDTMINDLFKQIEEILSDVHYKLTDEIADRTIKELNSIIKISDTNGHPVFLEYKRKASELIDGICFKQNARNN